MNICNKRSKSYYLSVILSHCFVLTGNFFFLSCSFMILSMCELIVKKLKSSSLQYILIGLTGMSLEQYDNLQVLSGIESTGGTGTYLHGSCWQLSFYTSVEKIIASNSWANQGKIIFGIHGFSGGYPESFRSVFSVYETTWVTCRFDHVGSFSGRIGQHASRCTAEQHSFGMTEAERVKRLQEEAKKNAVNGDVGRFLIFLSCVLHLLSTGFK